MISVAVVNRKGGPGKTTVAILAAIGLREKAREWGQSMRITSKGL